MNNAWTASFSDLKKFITDHPQIRIEPYLLDIPAEVRPEFYRLFGAVITTYLESTFPGILAGSIELGTEFARVKDETISRLNLLGIDFEARMKMFMENPRQALSDDLFDLLFGLIKGTVDTNHFERAAAQAVNKTFNRYFHLGYEYWAALSLVCMLAPNQSYVVPMANQKTDMEISSAHARPGLLEEIHEIAVSEYISLDHSRITPFVAPLAILHSSQLNTFAGVAIDLHEVFRNSIKPSKKMEWLNKEAMRTKSGTHEIWPDMAIYLDDEPSELRVAADYANIARPDVVVNVMDDPDWYQNGKLGIIQAQNKGLKPRLGSFIVCRGDVPETAVKEVQAAFDAEQYLIARQTEAGLPAEERLPASPPIYLLAVGYDRLKLEPVMDALVRSRTKAG